MLRSFRALLKRKARRRARNNDPIQQALRDLPDPPPAYDDSLSRLPVGGSGFIPLSRADMSDYAFAAVAAVEAVASVAVENARRVAAAADAARDEDAPAIAAAIAAGAADAALTIAKCFAAVYPTNQVLVTAVNETAHAIAITAGAIAAAARV
ncbi:hypothetical protein DL771_009996 [Monosporascus sp. 5C6A]|nr:hypothetical protein DL771_009996 [Monosporascus sp. 5C6A]